MGESNAAVIDDPRVRAVEPQQAQPITVALPEARTRPASPTKRYRIGLMGDAPRDRYAIAGIELTKNPEGVKFNEDGTPDWPASIPLPYGREAHLSDEQIERFKAGVLTRVVRWASIAKESKSWETARKGDVLDVRGAEPEFAPKDKSGRAVLTYRAPRADEQQDTPFGCYVFLYPVESGAVLPEHPSPMVARASA